MPHIFKSSPLSQHRARAPRALLFTRLACSLSYSTHACGACSGVDLIRMRVCSRSLPRYGAVLVAVWMTRRLDQATKSPTRQRCLSSRPSSSPGAHAAATYAFASSKPSVRPRERRAATWYEPTRARFPLTCGRGQGAGECVTGMRGARGAGQTFYLRHAYGRDSPGLHEEDGVLSANGGVLCAGCGEEAVHASRAFSLQTSGTEVPVLHGAGGAGGRWSGEAAVTGEVVAPPSARLTSQLSSVSPFEPLAHRRDVPSRATSYCAKRRYCTLTCTARGEGGDLEGGSSSLLSPSAASRPHLCGTPAASRPHLALSRLHLGRISTSSRRVSPRLAEGRGRVEAAPPP